MNKYEQKTWEFPEDGFIGTIEKSWKTKSGLVAFVTFYKFNNYSTGWRCGYVGVHKYHPLYKVSYNVIIDCINVHGYLTFSGCYKEIDKDLWLFGFDCAHGGDKYWFDHYGEERSVDFCVDECEKLAEKIMKYTKTK